MITKFKLFEQISNSPKVGYYVAIKVGTSLKNKAEPLLVDKVENNLGMVISANFGYRYVGVKFDNIEEVLFFNFNDIALISKNRNDIEEYLDSKKYNL